MRSEPAPKRRRCSFRRDASLATAEPSQWGGPGRRLDTTIHGRVRARRSVPPSIGERAGTQCKHATGRVKRERSRLTSKGEANFVHPSRPPGPGAISSLCRANELHRCPGGRIGLLRPRLKGFENVLARNLPPPAHSAEVTVEFGSGRRSGRSASGRNGTGHREGATPLARFESLRKVTVKAHLALFELCAVARFVCKIGVMCRFSLVSFST